MKIPWHRLLGLLLTDYLTPRGFSVELEKDLSLKRQYLDVVAVEQADGQPDLHEICDGFDNLGRHNLLSYKSLHQSLNAWAMEELIGHYVNYRKVLGLKKVRSRDIRLYAVCTRHPARLLKMINARRIKTSVWEASVLSRTVRILVLSKMPLEQRNAVLAFFTFDADKVRYALNNYTWQQDDSSTVINQLLDQYELEGIGMPYTMEQFRKEYVRAHINELPPEEVLSRYDPEEVLSRYDPEEVLSRYDPEDRLKGLEPHVIEEYLARLKNDRIQ